MLLGIPLVSAGVAAGGDAKAELKKFEGAWVVESGKSNGRVLPEKEAQQMTATFAEGKATFSDGGKKEKGSIKLDPGKKPRHIDLTIGSDTFPGIYAFEGGKLKLCYDEGGKRPTKFESPKGSKVSLLVLRRVKK
jgi:uncharacterized protein (TIGR03067 family)